MLRRSSKEAKRRRGRGSGIGKGNQAAFQTRNARLGAFERKHSTVEPKSAPSQTLSPALAAGLRLASCGGRPVGGRKDRRTESALKRVPVNLRRRRLANPIAGEWNGRRLKGREGQCEQKHISCARRCTALGRPLSGARP